MDIRQLFHDKLVHTNLTDNHPRLKGFINDIPSCKQQISDLGMRNCTELVAWYNMPFSLGGLWVV